MTVTAAEALRIVDPKIRAELRQKALDAGPLTDEQARIIARIFGPMTRPSAETSRPHSR